MIEEEYIDRSGVLRDIDPSLVDSISELVQDKARESVLELVADTHAADIARLLTHLNIDEARVFFSWLSGAQGSDVLTDLDDEYRSSLLEGLSSDQLGELIDELDTDDAADVIGDLPEELRADVLSKIEDSFEVKELLAYDEDTAGGLMDAEYVSVQIQANVSQATEEVRIKAEEVEPVYVVYVEDEEGRLEGVVSLTQLLLNRGNTKLASIMSSDVISVFTDTDQEEVARIMERYDLVALPVVDRSGILRGRITIDDAVDVIIEEAEEDLQKMSGVENEEITSSIAKVSRGRIVWLLVGLLGAVLSAFVILNFDEALKEATVLAMFIPVVMAMAGNVGIQSSAVAVQGLASGELWSSDLTRRMSKELAVSLINGLLLGLIIALVVLGIKAIGYLDAVSSAEILNLALTVALSLISVVIFAATTGAAVPLILHRLKIDPALATGPFITTMNDIVGLIIYFLIASWLFL